jgi:prevent-host-death family protein
MAVDQTSRRWPVQDAKARFSELLEASLNEGPQIVTRRGVEAAVLVPFEEWRRLQSSARPTLKELLLAETPRAEIPVPPRHRWRRRTPESLE